MMLSVMERVFSLMQAVQQVLHVMNTLLMAFHRVHQLRFQPLRLLVELYQMEM